MCDVCDQETAGTHRNDQETIEVEPFQLFAAQDSRHAQQLCTPHKQRRRRPPRPGAPGSTSAARGVRMPHGCRSAARAAAGQFSMKMDISLPACRPRATAMALLSRESHDHTSTGGLTIDQGNSKMVTEVGR